MKKKAKAKRIENKRANFGYEATDDLEVGMVLNGQEVKALRLGQMQLTGSYGRILQGTGSPELWLIGSQVFGTEDKTRSIKLLAHKAEIARLLGLVGQRGYTLVPSKVYFKNGRAKLQLNISKGLKMYEKRAKIRDRDIDRDIQRVVRGK